MIWLLLAILIIDVAAFCALVYYFLWRLCRASGAQRC